MEAQSTRAADNRISGKKIQYVLRGTEKLATSAIMSSGKFTLISQMVSPGKKRRCACQSPVLQQRANRIPKCSEGTVNHFVHHHRFESIHPLMAMEQILWMTCVVPRWSSDSTKLCAMLSFVTGLLGSLFDATRCRCGWKSGILPPMCRPIAME